MERKWENNREMGGAAVMGIRTSCVAGSDRISAPERASRCVRYGDRIFVRVVNLERGWEPVVDFEVSDVSDMSDVYGVLRQRCRNSKGLMKLYVRNATRGWSFEQPFKLYGMRTGANAGMEAGHGAALASRQTPAISVTHPLTQPQARRPIPDSIKTYDL